MAANYRRQTANLVPPVLGPIPPLAVPLFLEGQYPLGEEEAWRPSRTLAILYRLRAGSRSARAGSRSAWGRWKASADARA